MARSRSRSPSRRDGHRRRSRSHSREHRRHRGPHRSGSPGGSARHHHRSHKHSRSPTSRRHRSKSPDIFKGPSVMVPPTELAVTTGATNPEMLSPELQASMAGDYTDEELGMIQMMGFGGFDSSKGKAHTDGTTKANASAIQVKRKYRQYMNRRGGFNRPLDRIA